MLHTVKQAGSPELPDGATLKCFDAGAVSGSPARDQDGAAAGGDQEKLPAALPLDGQLAAW